MISFIFVYINGALCFLCLPSQKHHTRSVSELFKQDDRFVIIVSDIVSGVNGLDRFTEEPSVL